MVRRLAWHHFARAPDEPATETITAKAIMENIVSHRSARRANMFDHVVALDGRRGDSPRRTKRQALSELAGSHAAAGASISTDVIAAGCS
ncbi:MAG: hypothetical protein ACO37V_09225 [Ilumatobacteraceae bacterium]